MNKQLINKYKPEFDYFLNEGKLLCYTEVDGPYYEVTDEKWDFVCDIGFIINDEYVEFRKALAEGKTIQIYDVIEQHLSDRTFDKFGWRDFKSFTSSSSFSKTPDLYRIKPYEPKFKVGDFVTPLNRDINCSIWQIDNILSCNTLVSGSTMLDPRTLQPWTPVKGEWCWFYDDKFKKSSHLAKFKQMSRQFFESEEIGIYDYCEPFLNSIPSYLKDE